MAKLSILAGATSVSVAVFVQDSSSTTGAGLAGLVFNSAGLTCYAVVPGASAAAVTLATLAAANSAWATGGFKEIDATNMPGWYRFDIPNANIASGRSVGFHFKGATNMAPLPLEIELTGWNNQSTTDGGLSKLTSLTFTGANKVDSSVRDWVGDTIPARTVTGVPKVDPSTWDGTDITTGVPLAPTVAGRTLDVSAGGEAGVDLANVGSPTTALALTNTTIAVTQKVDVDTIKTNPVVNAGTVTMPTNATLASTTNITGGTIATVTNLTNAPTNGDLTAAMKASVTTAATAATPTAAAVTGNVGGNVTGNVGGNLTGSVGSLAAQAKTDVKTQVTDGLNVDTYAEPGQEAPGATVSLVKKIGYLYKAFRNRSTQTATAYKLYNDDALTVDQKSTVSDNGTTFDSGEKASGP